MTTEARIVRDPAMRGGSPTIEGTRITVTEIVRAYRWNLRELAGAYEEPPHPEKGLRISMKDITVMMRHHYPTLSEAQVRAALAYWHSNQDEIQDELDDETIAAIEARCCSLMT